MSGYSPASTHTGSAPVFAGAYQEQDHGQVKTKQQGKQKAAPADSQGKAGRQTDEETLGWHHALPSGDGTATLSFRSFRY